MKAFSISSLITLVLTAFLVSCAGDKTGTFFAAALGLGEGRIYLASSGVAAGTNYTVSAYDFSGNLKDIIVDYGVTAENARGIAIIDPFNLMVSVEGTDRLDVVSIFGGVVSSFINSNLTGTIFDLERDIYGNFYVAEGTTIEKFDASGNRYGAPYIGTSLSGCVQSLVHGMAVHQNGRLMVVDSGNDTLKMYNITATAAKCVASIGLGAIDPWDIAVGPTGDLFIATQVNDGIYRTTESGTNLTQIYNSGSATLNPSAIAVMPDGNILMANQGNDGVDLFNSSGTLLINNFIKNSMTVDVSDILVVQGQ